jgi:hypothetical protein
MVLRAVNHGRCDLASDYLKAHLACKFRPVHSTALSLLGCVEVSFETAEKFRNLTVAEIEKLLTEEVPQSYGNFMTS